MARKRSQTVETREAASSSIAARAARLRRLVGDPAPTTAPRRGRATPSVNGATRYLFGTHPRQAQNLSNLCGYDRDTRRTRELALRAARREARDRPLPHSSRASGSGTPRPARGGTAWTA